MASMSTFANTLDYTEKYAHPNNTRSHPRDVWLGAIGVEVRVRNYSRCKGRLLEETAAWMGLADDALKRPSTKRVNRSMTRGELVLQMALNSQLGPSGPLLSKSIVRATYRY